MSYLQKSGGRRFMALLLAAVLVLQSFVLMQLPERAAAAPAFQTSAEALPSTVAAGGTAGFNVYVTSSETTSILVDLEIFDASLKKVHQVFTDNVKLNAGEKKAVPFTWNVPAALPEGKYIVSFGLFGAGWNGMYTWQAGATNVTVTKGAPVLSFTSSAEAAPDYVQPGGNVVVAATVTASTYASALAEISLIRPDGSKALTTPFSATFEAGQPKTFPVSWTVPADAPQGAYQVEIAIYKPDRSETYSLNRSAAQFTVANEPPQNVPVPGNIRAAAEETTITLTWDAVSGATLYELEADGAIVQTASSSYAHTGLKADTQHTYRVRAKTATGISDWSSAVTVKTKAPSAAPALKISLETSSSTNTQQPSVAFKFENTGSTALNLKDLTARYYFNIDSEASLAVDFWSTITKSNVTTKFVKMPIPSADADYYLEIRFKDQAGTLNAGSYATVSTWFNKTDWSVFNQSNDYSFLNAPSYTATEKAPGYIAGTRVWGTEPVLLDMPAFPANIKATPADTSIRLAWDPVEGATGYEVYADGSTYQVTSPSYLHEWLRTGTKHTYKVRAVRDGKFSVWSSTLTVKTTGEQVLPAPSNVRAERSETSIKITWAKLDEDITGYDIEVDGAVFANGLTTYYTHSGLTSGSQHTYRVRARDGSTEGAWSELLKLSTIFVPTGTFNVNFNIDPTAEKAPISPYIYGTNDELTGTENWTARRMGGNRMSTYNWENNASNAGKDDNWRSDGYVPWFFGNIMDRSKWDIPGIGATAFHERSLSKGSYSLLTLQTAGYVAKDKDNTSVTENAPSSRWVEVKPVKGAPFSLTPDLNDNYVYMDEFVNLIVSKYGKASTATGVKGFEIDNEPALWAENHKYMHPAQTKGVEVLNKSIELAKAVKNIDPTVEMFGPVSYGFSEYLMMDNQAEWDTIKGSYSWYLDYYLDKLRIESEKTNRRLLDALDLHWYPEATGGGVRISNPYVQNNLETHKARVQAPRSLWDPSYIETSWIGESYSSYLPLIPRIKQSIDMYNPGTKLAFTEYNYGGEDNISGGIAMADVLGIFGKYGVYMANYWKMIAPEKTAYSSAAAKIYNNYDGNNSKYGDTKVKAETTDVENSSVYSSVYKDDDNNLHIIAINKNFDYDMNAAFTIAGDKSYTSAKVWAYDSNSPQITEREGITSISGNTFTLNIPKLTVAHIVLSASPSQP
ncbi:glycoside hydrolase family 44 protein [Paenibacillus hamazuiensis]|uniref:glycoside hydrolase family 44 protein n=1 Tax=Paenibacillus hamazuiensis TaxID=2936508 RepID=UPI00200CB4F3|nr:glycoside hydrolase family 44 protein [Paenibacillus hamazuiensis]